ncbi:NDP-sugar synthase [Nocardioides sp. ChNu-153]|uniref:NDP-sugar synthase n=1 Tax=unclassified Nocardioides TaxID=2615069 RepID=UPI0024060232|nr:MULTISPECIES: NDP-sugar synthase [unclassified Nocardioides]MDF9715647.1 NDP-sugar synthase [Nocardioides sp. ChNu-99]MDN7121631.1 NDP-sugar synthase [Nocardioides sp. ChNu-153]
MTPSSVEAVIVAGGFGSRLLPLTARRPKHLLDVGGVPFLEHQIARLAEAGVDHVVLATSYHADQFRPVLGDGSRWGVRIDYVLEEQPLGTGGAIRNVADALTDDPDGAVVILNGDVLSGHDLPAQLEDFRTPRDGQRVDVSLHLVEVEDARAFGCVPTDAAGRVTAFVEKSDDPVTNQVNAGCYVFRRDVIDTIPAGEVVSVERETFPGLVADGRLVVGFVETAYWRDVGTPAALVGASRDVVLGVAPTPAIGAAEAGARVAEGATVRSDHVGGGSVVMKEATVEAGAVVEGSIVMTGAVVEAGARVTDSVVGPWARVGRDAVLRGATLGDEVVVTAGAHVTDERVDVGSTVGAGD